MNAVPVNDDRHITTKVRTYDDKVYTNFCGLNVPEVSVESESFKINSIDSLLAYEKKYYPEVCLDNFAYKIVSIKMVDYLDDNLFETD